MNIKSWGRMTSLRLFWKSNTNKKRLIWRKVIKAHYQYFKEQAQQWSPHWVPNKNKKSKTLLNGTSKLIFYNNKIIFEYSFYFYCSRLSYNFKNWSKSKTQQFLEWYQFFLSNSLFKSRIFIYLCNYAAIVENI